METDKNKRSKTWREDMIDGLEQEYKVPVEWKDGPVQNRFRGVTDKCCLVIFLLYLVLMIVTMAIAFNDSNHEDITKIYDSSGNVCGLGKTKDYHLLYLQRFSKPYKSVCVKACPEFDYNEIKYKTAGGNDKAEAYPGPLDYKGFAKNFAGLSKTKDPTMDYQEAFKFDEPFVNGYFTEQQWENYQKKLKVECFANNEFSNCEGGNFDKGGLHFYDSYPVLNTVCVPMAPKPALLFNKVSAKFDHGVIGDMTDATSLFGWCALISLGVSLLFLVLVCLCTTLIAWILLLSLCVVFISFGAFVIFTLYYTGPLNSGLNAARVKYLFFLMENKNWLLAISIILIVLGLIMFILIIKWRKYISISIPILSVASKVSLKNILLILLSIFVIAVQIFVFFFELYILLRLYTSGEESHENRQGSPFVKYNNTDLQKFFMVVHIFGTYWLITVLNNLNDFVCSAVTVNYYFHSEIRNIRIFCHTLGHSIGSIAWSVILLPVLCIKIVFGLFDFLLTSDNPNGCQRFFNKILCPCCWCYEKFIDRFSESYFPVTYMGSENFFKATTRFYYLSEKYGSETSILFMMGGLFGIVGKLLISFLSLYFGFLIYENSMHLQQNIDNIGAMLGICFLLGFFIGSLFINLYATTYESLMVCYLIERNLEDLNPGVEVVKSPKEINDVLETLRNEGLTKYHELKDHHN
jgi:hypothetical protein